MAQKVVCRGEAVTRPHLAYQLSEQVTEKREHHKRKIIWVAIHQQTMMRV